LRSKRQEPETHNNPETDASPCCGGTSDLWIGMDFLGHRVPDTSASLLPELTEEDLHGVCFTTLHPLMIV
jgi:hypothetical protein